MATTHTLTKMREWTLLLLKINKEFKSNGELGIGTWKLCSATLTEKESHVPYHNAEMMESLAWKKVLRVVVLVRWKEFTGKFSSFVWKSSNVERETRQVVQTGERTWQTVFDNTFSKSSDVQEGEFVFFEINKFKSLGYYSFTTNSHGGFAPWSLWKTRQNKFTQFAKTLARNELAWSDNILCKWEEKNEKKEK